jgi:hypothetical protein
MMKMFVFTLKDYVLDWFDDCSPKDLSFRFNKSISQFLGS